MYSFSIHPIQFIYIWPVIHFITGIDFDFTNGYGHNEKKNVEASNTIR